MTHLFLDHFSLLIIAIFVVFGLLVVLISNHLHSRQLKSDLTSAQKDSAQKTAELKEYADRLNVALEAAEMGSWETRGPEQTFHFDKKYGELLEILKPSPITFAEFVGHFQKVMPDFPQEAADFLLSTPLEAQFVPKEFKAVLSNGRVIHLANRCVTVYNDDKTPNKTLGIMYDITSEKLMEYDLIKTQEDLRESMVQAQQASSAKSSFLANMSHEIRTPMNAIVGMSDLLILSQLSDLQRVQVENIKVASTSLLKIINDILDFSKIDANKMELVFMPIDFASIINDVSNIINIKASDGGIAFIITIGKDVPTCITADEIRLKQILVNLLGNSVKFTKKGFVKLSINSRREADGQLYIDFVIEDSGIGIKRDEFDKLFAEFEQIDTRRNKNITGTGLGLPISKKLIELMGGNISVESTYGRGSKFSFYIKTDDNNSNPLAEVKDPKSVRLLCFEPDTNYMQSIIEMCNDFGIEFDWCHDKDDLEKIITTEEYTHILFDYDSGYDLIKKHANVLEVTAKTAMKGIKNTFDDADITESVSIISKPLMVSYFAKILNNEFKTGDFSVQQQEMSHLFSFTAPDAKVLVVDDNLVNIAVASSLLKHFGITIDESLNGLEALANVKTKKYDLVFMDHMMPGMDGIDTTKIIRNLGERFSYDVLPIVALTANAIQGAKETFLACGMNDFISKPIDLKQLADVLKAYLPAEKIILKTADEIAQAATEPKTPAAPTQSAGKAKQDNETDDDFFERVLSMVPEIDADSCLTIVAGDVNMYLEFAKVVTDCLPENIELLEKEYKSNNISGVAIQAHSIKSSLNNVSINGFGKRAFEIETAAKDNNAAIVDDKIGSFLNDVRSLHSRMKLLFP